MNNMYYPNNFAPQTGAQPWYNQNDFGISTNFVKVQSLEDAITRSNVRPSENIYFHESKPEFYNVRVDINGNKTWQTFPYTVATPAQADSGVQITKEQFEILMARLDKLEGKPAEEVVENG